MKELCNKLNLNKIWLTLLCVSSFSAPISMEAGYFDNVRVSGAVLAAAGLATLAYYFYHKKQTITPTAQVHTSVAPTLVEPEPETIAAISDWDQELYNAVCVNDAIDPKRVKIAVANKADVNAENDLGETVLMQAVKNHASLEIIKLLLSNSAELNERVIAVAERAAHADILEFLQSCAAMDGLTFPGLRVNISGPKLN